MATPQVPNQLAKPSFSKLDPALDDYLSKITDSINSIFGYNGTIALGNDLHLGGKRIMAVGAPQEETDALSSGVAQGKYSVQVLAPQLESNASTGLKTMRRLNDTKQREQQSSYLNDLMSSVPSANQIFPLITNSGGSVSVTIPASPFVFADGSNIQLISRTDLLSAPAQYAIATISCVGNMVTVVLTGGSPLVAGQAMTVAQVSPSIFNGTVGIVSSTAGGSTLTYQADLGTVSGSGGYVQTNGIYYYYVNKRDSNVHLAGPYPSDTMQNRIQVCFDGSQIVAVVAVTNSGGQVSLSGGGGSPMTGSPTAGSFF